MAVIKKGNKYYVVLEMGVDPETKRRKQKWFSGYDSEDEAATAERAILTDMDRGVWVEPSKLTFHSFLATVWFPARKLKSATKLTYTHFINRLGQHPIGQINLQKVQPLHCETYMQYLYSIGLSSTSVRHEMSMIKGALNWAVKKDLLVKSPARTLELPERSKFKPKFLDAKGIDTLLELAKFDKIEMPVRLAGTSGLRNAEVAGLTWPKIDFDNLELHVEFAFDYIKEGENKGKLGFVDLKTINADRIVPVTSETAAALKKHKTLQEAVLEVNGWTNPNQLVNIQLDNGRPCSPDYIDRRFARFLKNKRLAPMRFHDLRHSFAVNLRDAGVPMETISELLGHYDSVFSHKTYAHPVKDTHQKAVQALEKHLSSAKGNTKITGKKIVRKKIKKISAIPSNVSNNLLTDPK